MARYPDSDDASRRELAVLLANSLAGLPETEAEVLWLHHAEGLSFKLIGERMGVTRWAVRGIWARGLKSVKRTLEGPAGAR